MKTKSQQIEFTQKYRKHHSGPVTYLKTDQSKKLRALRGTSTSPKLSGVRVIMRDGEILQPKSIKKILHQDLRRIPRSESKLMERYAVQAAVPAKTNPGATQRNRLGLDLDHC